MNLKILNFFVFITILLLSNKVNSEKILAIFHMSSYSHFIMGNTLLKALADKGHEVTMISAFEQKPPVKNYRSILVPEITEYAKNLDLMKMRKFTTSELVSFLNHMTYTVTELTLNNTKVQKLLKSNENFDLIIIEQFMNEAFRGFQHHYNAPCIIFSTVRSNTWTNIITGNPGNPSYIAELFSPFSDKMTFFERLQNLLYSLVTYLSHYLYALPSQNDLMHKYFPNAPHLNNLLYNTSLILINSHSSISQPVPLLPNMIEIAGMHIKSKKLPGDIKKFLDDGKNGVIYFSLGSNLKSKNLDNSKRNAIINVFNKLNMRILWKFEDENLMKENERVKISNWLPQQDILAHPNVKMFITHGGFLSTIETIYHGKPILGIPFFGDQTLNMQQAENYGFGKTLHYDDLTEETFSSTLNDLLSNPKYKENVEKRSKAMRDQPMEPLERAVYWVEYVIRQNGAYHFRSSALDLKWYEYLLLDVIGFILICTSLVFLLIYGSFKVLMNLFFKKSAVKFNKND